MKPVQDQAAQLPESDDAYILRLFDKKVREFTVLSVCHREFIRVEQLRKWMNSEIEINGISEGACHRLLRASYRQYLQHHPGLPITDTSMAKDEDEGCVTVFAILLSIAKGHIVHLFQRYHIMDKLLPMRRTDLKTGLEHIEKDLRRHGSNEYMALEDINKLVEAFDKAQWKFNPAKLSLDMDKTYAEFQVIPICRWEHIHLGGIADVWQIMVQEEFVKESLRNAIPNARFESEEFGWVFTIIYNRLNHH
jgi:hypothetical protein